jgi:hypothetical protein
MKLIIVVKEIYGKCPVYKREDELIIECPPPHFVSGGENPMKFHHFSPLVFKPSPHFVSGGRRSKRKEYYEKNTIN